MGNQFKIDLDGRYVIIKNDWIYKDFSEESETIQGTVAERVFYCRGGFGCDPKAHGTLIGGFIVHNKHELGIRGFGYIERLATEVEIKEAIIIAKKKNVEIKGLTGG